MTARSLEGDRVELFEVRIVKQTDAAFRIEYAGEEHWIPKSAVHDDSPVYRLGDEGDMIVARWWAEKLKLMDDE